MLDTRPAGFLAPCDGARRSGDDCFLAGDLSGLLSGVRRAWPVGLRFAGLDALLEALLEVPEAGRTGERSGLVQGDTLEEAGREAGPRRSADRTGLTLPVVLWDVRMDSSRMNVADSVVFLVGDVPRAGEMSVGFLGSTTSPSGMVRKHLMGVNLSGLVSFFSTTVVAVLSARWNSSLAKEPSELYSGDFSRVVLLRRSTAAGRGPGLSLVGVSLTGDASLLVPLRVSEDDLRVSWTVESLSSCCSLVQVAEDDTEVLLVVRVRLVVRASRSLSELGEGERRLGLVVGEARGEACGEAPGVPDLFLVAARDALDVKRRLSLLALRRIVDESKVLEVMLFVGEGTRGEAPLLSGVVARLPLVLRGEEGREDSLLGVVLRLGTPAAGLSGLLRSMEPLDTAGVGLALGLARSALAKYWCVGLRSWLTRLLLYDCAYVVTYCPSSTSRGLVSLCLGCLGRSFAVLSVVSPRRLCPDTSVCSRVVVVVVLTAGVEASITVEVVAVFS